MTKQNKKAGEMICVKYSKGGMREYQRTGIYPRHLTFFSKKYDREWSRKLKGETKKGCLTINKEVVYKYHFDENEDCTVTDKHGNEVEVYRIDEMCD